jgi:hypothetical protein
VALNQPAPLRSLPNGVADLGQFRVRRRDRADGVSHEYRLAALVFGPHKTSRRYGRAPGERGAVLALPRWAAPEHTHPAWHPALPLDAQESLWYLLCVSDDGLLNPAFVERVTRSTNTVRDHAGLHEIRL